MAGALPPSLPGTPGLGMLPAMRRDVLGTLERARRELGDVVRLEIGPPGLRVDDVLRLSTPTTSAA